MTQYLDLLERILSDGMRKRSKFSGDIIFSDGLDGNSDGFQTFYFNSKPVRGKLIDGEPWLVGKDVAEALGYAKPENAIAAHVDIEDKTTTPIQGSGSKYKTRVTIINESGVYSLTFSSKLKEAKTFKRWVTKEVIPSIRKTGSYGVQSPQQLPDFLQRVMLNIGQVPNTHFSVISELYSTVYGAFEKVGHRLSDRAADGVRLRPDVSVGKCFATWLHNNGFEETDGRIEYAHKFPDGYEVKTYAYPNKLLGVFRDNVYQEWLSNQAHKYLKYRDPKALEYLPKLLTA